MCGGVGHYNPRFRTAATSMRFGDVQAKFDAWGTLEVRDIAKGVSIAAPELATYGEDGRKLAAWIRSKSTVLSLEFPE